jgi:vacuolar-type H+-ATPase subunit E/Vma4
LDIIEMKTIDESIENLKRAMLSEAKAEAEQAQATAKAKAETIKQHAKEQAAELRAKILDRTREEAERLSGQVKATSQMKARTMELEKREKLLDMVFSNSKDQLASIQTWSDYEQIALKLMKEALSQIKAGQVLVRADASTLQYFTEAVLEQISKETDVQISLGAPLEHGIGVIATTTDGHLYYDNTLETRLIRLQNSLRLPIYRVLIGEKI